LPKIEDVLRLDVAVKAITCFARGGVYNCRKIARDPEIMDFRQSTSQSCHLSQRPKDDLFIKLGHFNLFPVFVQVSLRPWEYEMVFVSQFVSAKQGNEMRVL
jgi:hypothetical protein